MIRQVSGDTKIAFCPWSARLLSYLGLRGKRAGGRPGYCQTDKLGTTQYSDGNHLNWNDLDQKILMSGKLISICSPR